MIRSMTKPGVPIGKRDVAIAVVFSLLGVLLMYENATDSEINVSYLAIPVSSRSRYRSSGGGLHRCRPSRPPPCSCTSRSSGPSFDVASSSP